MSIINNFPDVKAALVAYANLAKETQRIQDANILEEKANELASKRRMLENLSDYISFEIENVDLFLTTNEDSDECPMSSTVVEELKKSRPNFKGIDKPSRTEPSQGQGLISRIFSRKGA